MDKLRMMSMDNVQMNVEKIQKLFPNAVTEVLRDGKPALAIDFDVLKQELSAELIDDKEERYQMTWPGKKKSILLANTPISATLRPCKDESVDFDNTQNLYIEGDNLDVLKLLQETYLGKIKMIYIDPPYNTGNDFIYNDDFAMDSDDYADVSGQYDEQGNRLFLNTESNGRFHTDWLNMMYPRLKIAKEFLTEGSLIFISLDESEIANLRKMCDEVFGEKNLVGNVIWKKTTGDNKSSFAYTHDNILVYGKFTDEMPLVSLNESQLKQYKNPDNDCRGVWAESDYRSKWSKRERPNLYYGIKNPNTGETIYPDTYSTSTRVWAFSKDAHEKNEREGLVWWGIDGQAKEPKKKRFLTEHKGANTRSIWLNEGTNDEGGSEVKLLMEGDYFDNPKPLRLLKKIVSSYSDKDSIILDFFSGSATTAHAVMQLNAEDGGKRKYIMVQLPEKCDEKSEAFKAGYDNICEIGKERIRRAGKKIKEENPLATQDLDIGFRVLKLDSSNMKDVYYKPSDYSQGFLGQLEDNIKADRTPLDLLFQVMLDLGKPLSAKIEEREIAGKRVFVVDGNDLIACFDSDITEDIVKTIAQLKPLYAVFRDSGLSSDSVGANFDQIFATYSPNTTRKVL